MIIHVVAGSLIVTLAAIVALGFVRDRRAARRIGVLESRITQRAKQGRDDHREVMERLGHLEELINKGHETAEYAIGYVDGIRAPREVGAESS